MDATPTPIPKSLKTAQGVIQGLTPLADVLGVHFGIDLADDAPWSEWLFMPEGILSDLCDPANRCLLVPALSRKEAQALNRSGPEGARASAKVLGLAAKEALQTLVELAEGSAVGTPRLRARLCVAVRQELAALVAEWADVSQNEGAAGGR